MSRTLPWCSRLSPRRLDSCIGGEGWAVSWGIEVFRYAGRGRRADNIPRRCVRRVLQGPSPAVKESMGWYGKLIGAVLGAIIGRGLFGAIVGLLIGHQFDRRSSSTPTRVASDPRSLSVAFFRATFQAMGHVAKADGRVTPQEIDAARDA